MHNTDLDEEHGMVFAFLSENQNIGKKDYLSLKTGEIFFVANKAGGYTVYRKTENFDDDFLKIIQDKGEAEAFLKGQQ